MDIEIHNEIITNNDESMGTSSSLIITTDVCFHCFEEVSATSLK